MQKPKLSLTAGNIFLVRLSTVLWSCNSNGAVGGGLTRSPMPWQRPAGRRPRSRTAMAMAHRASISRYPIRGP
ncbi:hypothetical protein BHM03_00040592 [Ensete ventricosum]|uniref:Secreted protein n=1 Tax=Ensete ventricosum TaxID=4639 RepID=A0A427AGU1_ENSVE|nr:hypothetical protein B296_00027443 [Ensete ventricosum]RZS09507.1 hypothetical protein BHM03_00040592 [Ensete ventricosum]